MMMFFIDINVATFYIVQSLTMTSQNNIDIMIQNWQWETQSFL